MAGQEQKSTDARGEEEAVDVPTPAAAPGGAQDTANTQGVDDLLDEIDNVLETNAEEFVRGFVQKGGQ
ncbi:ubiquitin-like protein Pup [Sinomonas notoginsengisoli]|uniref:ubiquitin-like protein Pup n=1 Tax=Sinomonas notoginsengisoli TaxID=1457311 RepID=UPI001F471BF7|nr:ubiquitin-like protein Pup [Sinomonas notoginsengisoli]